MNINQLIEKLEKGRPGENPGWSITNPEAIATAHYLKEKEYKDNSKFESLKKSIDDLRIALSVKKEVGETTKKRIEVNSKKCPEAEMTHKSDAVKTFDFFNHLMEKGEGKDMICVLLDEKCIEKGGHNKLLPIFKEIEQDILKKQELSKKRHYVQIPFESKERAQKAVKEIKDNCKLHGVIRK